MSSSALQDSCCARLSDSDGSDSGSEGPTAVPIVKLSPPESVEEQLPDDGFNVSEEKDISHTPLTPTPTPDDENGSHSGVVEEENKRKRASPEKTNEGTEGTGSESSSSKSGGGVGHNKEAELDKSSSPDVNAVADQFIANQMGLDRSGKKARLYTLLDVLRQLEENLEEDTSIYSKSLLEVAEEKWGPFSPL